MSGTGPAGNGSSATDAANRETDSEAPRRRSTLLQYNSFPSYSTIQYETSNGYETTQYTAAGSKLQTRVLGPDLLRGLLMMFMAMDHLGVMLKTWNHGLGNRSEEDGAPVTEWNFAVAYFVRTLTHLCAPGFTMLLGMGVVYLGNSRKKQGWSASRLIRYFALRMVVLTLVMIAESIIITFGEVWFLNIVLFALAVDYFLAGVIWLAIESMEEQLTGALTSAFTKSEATRDHDSDSDAEQPLLYAGRPQMSHAEQKASRISWHVHNLLLVVLSVVTIFWNIWLSPDQGQCTVKKADSAKGVVATFMNGAEAHESANDKHWWLHIWFWSTQGSGVMSPFPPLAWLSFAIIGILYGRVVISDPRSTQNLVRHVCAGVLFSVVFVLTRLLHFGNLTEHCLQTPEHTAHPERNQYLTSPSAFFYIAKYPPDVAFWAFTLAVNFFILAALWQIPVKFAKRWLAIMLDFGTTSLFFYLVHMFVVTVVGWTLSSLFGHDTGYAGPQKGTDSRKGIDNVPAFFGIWALCMLIMWPLCRWYGKFKFAKPSDSLWRIF